MQFNSGGLGWSLGCGTARISVSAIPPHFRGGIWIASFWKWDKPHQR